MPSADPIELERRRLILLSASLVIRGDLLILLWLYCVYIMYNQGLSLWSDVSMDESVLYLVYRSRALQ